MSAANEPQPLPTPAEGDVWAELIAWHEKAETPEPLLALMRDRRMFGIAKHGTPLQRGNGRIQRVDATQELLDAMVYAQADDPGSPMVVLIGMVLALSTLPREDANREAMKLLSVVAR